MNLNNFLILKNTKKFILSLEKLIITFPKKDIITRNMIYNDSLELLELIIKANYELDLNIRRRYKIECIGKIGKIDFYLERAFHFRYISEKQLDSKAKELETISKMIYIWCRNDK